MAISMDWGNRIVLSDASITDIVAFREDVRLLESSAIGQLYPPIITYKKVDSGGGAFQHFVDLINSYQLRFPVAGNYEILGNINGDIVPEAGVFVDRTKATSFLSGSGGGTGSFTQADRDDLLITKDYSAEAARNTQPTV